MKFFASSGVWLTLIVLLARAAVGLPFKVLCSWYPSEEYMDVGMECSGRNVRGPPASLPSSLELLRFTGSGMRALDRSSFHGQVLPDLTSLRITRGVLSSVGPDALCSLPQLEQLDLSHNRLKYLEATSFMCNEHLRSLSLSGNPTLDDLPTLVSTSIQTLYLDNCNLTDLNFDALDRMTALRTLSLDGNTGLDCLFTKQQFGLSRPQLTVHCGDVNDHFNQSVKNTAANASSSVVLDKLIVAITILTVIIIAIHVI